MATVTKIPATVSRYTATPIQTRVKRKVAAYARVSTDHEDQLNSSTTAEKGTPLRAAAMESSSFTGSISW